MLLSAFTSIGSVVKNVAGRIAEALVKQRFDNLSKISSVDSPILIIHGRLDDLVPIDHAYQLRGRMV